MWGGVEEHFNKFENSIEMPRLDLTGFIEAVEAMEQDMVEIMESEEQDLFVSEFLMSILNLEKREAAFAAVLVKKVVQPEQPMKTPLVGVHN